MSALDVLSIRNLQVACIVGVFPSERDTPQPLFVDVDLELDTRPSAKSETLSATLDYGRAAGELRFLLESGRFRLLETAADALVHWLLAPPSPERHAPRVERARVRLTKPEALGGGALVSLDIARDKSEVVVETVATAWGAGDVVSVARDCGIYRRRIAPGRSSGAHLAGVDVHELVLGDHLEVQRRHVPAGVAHHWGRDVVRRYDNASDVEQALLCVARPPLAHVVDLDVVVDEPAVLTLPPSIDYAPPRAR